MITGRTGQSTPGGLAIFHPVGIPPRASEMKDPLVTSTAARAGAASAGRSVAPAPSAAPSCSRRRRLISVTRSIMPADGKAVEA
ncbi:Uncharacterised protein [Mycobacteroides abscessus subsp. abscessus]|nr:Uncharacterised protein [Mycobacteroides abscessus subsp. abscessus]